MRAVILALALGNANGIPYGIDFDADGYPEIAGYTPFSNVVPHARIDVSAYALIKALSGKTIGQGTEYQTAVKNADGDYTTPSAVAMAASMTDAFKQFDLAYDLYTNGGGGSSIYVTYKEDGTNPLLDKAFTGSTSDYACVQTDGSSAAGSQALKIGTPKSIVDATATSVKIYLNEADSTAWEKCGSVGYVDPATTPTAHTAIFSEPECPQSTGLASQTVVCTHATVPANTVTVTFGGDLSFYQRNLKDFSTGGHTKMMNYNMKEFMALKEFHGNDRNAETIVDETIQLAFNALRPGTKGTQAFSSCETSAGVARNQGVTELACEAEAGTGYVFTQGNAICKDKSTRRAFIPGIGSGYDSSMTTYQKQVAYCEANNGKVTNFYGVSSSFLTQVVKKVAVYGNAWMYAIYEFVDAIKDCEKDIIDNNDAGVHAWDEGVAFYTGSMAGAKGYDQNSDGTMIYELAVKRCGNYGTCTSTTAGNRCTSETDPYCGNAKVNQRLFQLFVAGQFDCQTGDCVSAQKNLDLIIPLMRVPLIQGTLRYAYKISETTAAGMKEIGEGYAFMMTVVHAVGKCNAADGALIYDALDMPPYDPNNLASNTLAGGYTFADVKKAFEDNYECLGILCSDVGALSSGGEVYPGAEACADPAPPVPAPPAAAPAAEPAVVTNAPTTDINALPDWALYAFIGGGAVIVLLFGLMCSYKSGKDTSLKMYQDLSKTTDKEGAIAEASASGQLEGGKKGKKGKK